MPFGNIDDIKNVVLKRKVIHIIEWGDKDYIIQELTGKSAVILNEKLPVDEKGNPMLVASSFPLIISVSMVDEQGNFLFDTDDKRAFLENQPAVVLNKITQEIIALSGLQQRRKANRKN
jgi:hypothetical protein